MVAFQQTPSDMQRLDYLILRDGPIALYFDLADLETTCQWFRNQSYQVYLFDCRKWETPSDFYSDFYAATSQASNIADCGYNLDALRDCLAYFNTPLESGAIFVFDHFDTFTKSSARFAQDVLEILAEISRFNLLFGQRFIMLLHSDDPELTLRSVGASYILPARWKP